MRKMMLGLVLAMGLGAAVTSGAQVVAQPVAPRSDWVRVQNVATATNLHVNTNSSHVFCQLKEVDAESLTCVHDFQAIKFQRTEITSIRVAHRTRSTWIGVLIGYVGTAAVGAHADSNGGYGDLGVAVLALVLGAAGALIGHFTDFTSHLLYKVN